MGRDRAWSDSAGVRLGSYAVGLLVPPEGGAETIALVRQNLGLDQPYYVQFLLFIKQIVIGNLGISFRTQRPVLDLVGSGLFK